MSRYILWPEDESLEVFVGYDEGYEAFYLTIADGSEDPDEPAAYRFHNLAHHPTVGMTLSQVSDILLGFGLALPPDLKQQLAAEALGSGRPDLAGRAAPAAGAPDGSRVRELPVLHWRRAF
jgi:hypothetical protein